jgi:hypothetical protein
MSDSIFDVLAPYFDSLTDSSSRPDPLDPPTTAYLNRITTLDLAELSSTEPASISQALHSNLRSLQALSKRTHKSIILAAQSLAPLTSQLPSLVTQSNELQDALPEVESKAAAFADKYRKSNESTNSVLQERRNALLLARNADRVSSVLDLPTLLSSAISTGQQSSIAGSATTTGTSSSGVGSSLNYGSALDLHAHVKRLASLYPNSPLVASIATQSEVEMRLLTTNLISSLRSPNIKLAGAMRTVSWLRRVAPELDDHLRRHNKANTRIARLMQPVGGGDGALGALFLVCRLASLDGMLEALEPFRDLADQESAQRAAAIREKAEATTKKRRDSAARNTGPTGQQSERYLKKYVEVFREQSFAIVSMYKSIFPGALPAPGSHELQSTRTTSGTNGGDVKNVLLPLPSPLATFPAHLVDRLYETLRTYLPNVTDAAARDSLLTQVLYCAGSMGRLGGDFSMMLALLEEDLEAELAESERPVSQSIDEEDEWVKVMKKHRVQASRLELLASGVGTGRAREASIA